MLNLFMFIDGDIRILRVLHIPMLAGALLVVYKWLRIRGLTDLEQQVVLNPLAKRHVIKREEKGVWAEG